MNTAGTQQYPFGLRKREKRARSLTQQVVSEIEEQIRSGAIIPGDRLPPETDIVAQRGVSRTVVREAISRLQAAGLVETRHGVGTFVLKPRKEAGFGIDPSAILTIRDLLHMLEFRISIESDAAALAAMRAGEEDLQAMRRILRLFEQGLEDAAGTIQPDYEFHLQVASATANHYFKEIMGHFQTAIVPRTRINTAELGRVHQLEYLNRVNREHQDIYDAIALHDPEAARAAMRLHLTNSRERLRRAHDAANQGDPSFLLSQ
jgi:DNA-binding FadR family transcriptional regulator